MNAAMEQTPNKSSYLKGFIPFAFAAAVLSLCGGFTAAVPSAVASEWGLGETGATWITLAFALSAAGMAPIMGKLGDLVGRRPAVLLGLGLMALGEFLIGISHSFLFLLVARFILGAGAAVIAPVVIGYILTEFPREKSGQGFAIYMFIASAMVIFGPAAGGLMIDAVGWRPVLYLCVGFCVVGILVSLALIKKSDAPQKSLAGFDGLGSVFVLLFFSLFLCIPNFGQTSGWLSRVTLVCIGAAVVSLVLLVVVESRAKHPILNKDFMARKQFILPVIALFLTQGLMQSCMTNTILFVITTQQNTTLSGIATSLMYVGMSVGAIVIGPMADKKEPRTVAAAALIFVAVGAGLQMLYTETTGLLLFGLSLLLIGLGLGGNATIFMKVALSGLTASQAGVGSGTYNMFRDMSAPFGVAVFVPMFSRGIAEAMAGGADVIKANVEAIRSTALVQVGCVVVGILVCLVIPRIYTESHGDQA